MSDEQKVRFSVKRFECALEYGCFLGPEGLVLHCQETHSFQLGLQWIGNAIVSWSWVFFLFATGGCI